MFSRIFSNIENIFAARQVTEAQNPRSKVPKVAPKPAQNLQNLKSSVGIDPKPTVLVAAAITQATQGRANSQWDERGPRRRLKRKGAETVGSERSG